MFWLNSFAFEVLSYSLSIMLESVFETEQFTMVPLAIKKRNAGEHGSAEQLLQIPSSKMV